MRYLIASSREISRNTINRLIVSLCFSDEHRYISLTTVYPVSGFDSVTIRLLKILSIRLLVAETRLCIVLQNRARSVLWRSYCLNGYGGRLEILKNAVFWDVALCRSCVNLRFGGTYRLQLQDRKIRE
jgi:hypothetical protein